MIPFELAEPRSLAEAIRLLDPDDGTVRRIADGTALMLMTKAGVFWPAKLVSLRKIENKYAGITARTDGLTIGAMTTLADLERSADVRRYAPIITRTLLTLSNVRVRNVATVGGALAHGDPHMDLPPVLMALGASVASISPDGKRGPIVGGARGHLHVSGVPRPLRRHVHRRDQLVLGQDGLVISGEQVFHQKETDAVKSARIVASAATEKATRLNAALLRRTADASVEEAEFVADARGSVPYKRELMRVYVERAVHAACTKTGRTDGHA
jgi:aerobic carbon-monoxide dehydrogenase medium subunit